MTNNYTVGIIGAGPVGLQMAYVLHKAKISYLVLEKQQVGQTIFNWGDNTRFHSSPDFIKVGDQLFAGNSFERLTKEEYLNHLRSVVSTNKLKINIFEEVKKLNKLTDGFIVNTKRSDGVQNQYFFNHLILAIGCYHKRIFPKIKGLPPSKIKYCNFPLHYVFYRKIIIIGGRHSALEYALKAYRVGAKEITIICRHDPFKADRLKKDILEDIRKLIERQKISLYSNINEYEVNSATFCFKDENGKLMTKEYDYVISACGFKFDFNLFRQLGLKCNRNGKPILSQNLESSIKNCYVIGTAVAGVQASNHSLFIENSLPHVDLVLHKLQIT